MTIVSAAFKNIDAEECEFFWEDVLIAEEDLVALIKAKKSCAHFKLIVKERGGEEDSDESDYDPAVEEGEAIHGKCTLSGPKFRDYISADVQTKFLLKQDPLEPSVRKSIIDCALKYLFKECGQVPNRYQREVLAKVICEVFRAYKTDEELVLQWVLQKYKNVRSKLLHISRNNSTASKRSAEYLEDAVQMDVLESKLEFLETRLDADDIPGIERALQLTLKHRIEKYGNGDFSVFDTYKFFSKSLDLVSWFLTRLFVFTTFDLVDSV